MPIHPYWQRNVCLIAQRSELEVKKQYNPSDLKILGSGCLMTYKNKTILITAKHTIEGRGKVLYLCNFEIDQQEGGNFFLDIESIQEKFGFQWHFHKNPAIDLAVIRALSPPKSFGFYESSFIPFSELLSGSNVYFLGFPLGLVPADDLTPITKKAIIARTISRETSFPVGKGEFRKFPAKTILIDGYIDEGNSGSPVIQEQESFVLQYKGLPDRKPNRSGLLGIATGHFTTGYKNAGLGICVSIDYLLDILNSPEMKKDYDVIS